jgi:hypothetical protein
MRARYCDPGTGRFVSEDPGRSGENWYQYCLCDPINFIDNNGRDPLAVIAKWWSEICEFFKWPIFAENPIWWIVALISTKSVMLGDADYLRKGGDDIGQGLGGFGQIVAGLALAAAGLALMALPGLLTLIAGLVLLCIGAILVVMGAMTLGTALSRSGAFGPPEPTAGDT